MKKRVQNLLFVCFILGLVSCQSRQGRIINSITNLSNSNPEIGILNWRIIGPLADTSYSSTFLSFKEPLSPIPTELLSQGILDTLYTQKKGFFIDLGEVYNNESKNVAYALSLIKAKNDGEVAFLIGVDDNIRLWVNNELCLETEGSRRLLKDQIIKKIRLKEGDNYLVAEIENTREGPWMFRLDIATVEHVRYNALGLEYYNSSSKPAIAWKDSLHILISNPEIIPVTKPCRLEVYDVDEKLVLTRHIKFKKEVKVCLDPLKQGAYSYLLYTDMDTLDGIFSYGDIDQIYNRDNLLAKFQDDKSTLNLLDAYIKRMDHLLTLPREDISHSLSKRIAWCLYKICEIDHKATKNKELLRNITGLQLRTFRSSIDNSDDYYLLYIPKSQKNIPENGRPLMVIVPYVTSGHEFYIGSTMLHMERLNYISKFAEEYGVAVLWPSGRVYVRYNMTPIVASAIEETIDEVGNISHIDRENVLFYGDCSGGLFALLASIQNPELCTALALHGPELSSIPYKPETIDPSTISNDIYGMLDNIVDKPMKIFQSINDEWADHTLSKRLANEFKKRGGYVEYDDLRENTKGNKGNGIAKMISEQECMRKTFDFFQAQRSRKQRYSKHYVSYATYRDTVYGIHIRDKISSGKASFNYTISNNWLRINTKNIRSFDLDLTYFDIPDTENFKIRLNGQDLGQTHLRQKQNALEVSVPFNKELSNYNGFRKAMPINSVFRERFVIVRPDSSNRMTDDIIHIVDSVWRDEYRKSIRIVDESRIHSDLDPNTNIVFVKNNLCLKKISSSLGLPIEWEDSDSGQLEKGNIENISYAFISNSEEGSLCLTIGTNGNGISKDFVREILQQGWKPYSFWSNLHEKEFAKSYYDY